MKIPEVEECKHVNIVSSWYQNPDNPKEYKASSYVCNKCGYKKGSGEFEK